MYEGAMLATLLNFYFLLKPYALERPDTCMNQIFLGNHPKRKIT